MDEGIGTELLTYINPDLLRVLKSIPTESPHHVERPNVEKWGQGHDNGLPNGSSSL